jgi:hypothetical protein
MQEDDLDESKTEETGSEPAATPRVKSLPDAIADSRLSLDLIGDTDWTPQDGVHSRLLEASKHAFDKMLEAYSYLADPSRDPDEAISLARESLKRVRDGDENNAS